MKILFIYKKSSDGMIHEVVARIHDGSVQDERRINQEFESLRRDSINLSIIKEIDVEPRLELASIMRMAGCNQLLALQSVMTQALECGYNLGINRRR